MTLWSFNGLYGLRGWDIFLFNIGWVSTAFMA